jgi:hypothetical protein
MSQRPVTQERFEFMHPLAGISMSPAQSRQAHNAMRDGELVTDLLLRVIDDAHAVVASIAGGLRRLAGALADRLNQSRDGVDLERETFLSRAVDVADLERRIQAFEQRTQSLAGWPHPTA